MRKRRKLRYEEEEKITRTQVQQASVFNLTVTLSKLGWARHRHSQTRLSGN